MKDVLYNFLSSCNDMFWWSLKYSKDTLFLGLKYSRDTAFWFTRISSNGVVYGAKMVLGILTYSNDLFFSYMKFMWHSASRETLYTVCVWFRENWQHITSPEVRSYIVQGFIDWARRERNGFINNLEGPYGIQTFMMLAFLCILMGIYITITLNPDYGISEEELDMFDKLAMDPYVLIAQERALDAQREREWEHRMFTDPDFNALDHPRVRRQYIEERQQELRARRFAESPLADLIK